MPDPYPDRNKPTARVHPRVQPGCDNDGSCGPEILPHTLTLTIHSVDVTPGKAPSPDAPINSIHELFEALRTCWEPPTRDQAQQGVQMSVRFSFKRSGDIIAPPFMTYATPGTKADTKQVYLGAINAAIARCAPLPFSKSFGAAIAGQPISIRYIDDRAMNAGAPP